jgi:hypothetical protein
MISVRSPTGLANGVLPLFGNIQVNQSKNKGEIMVPAETQRKTKSRKAN